MYYVILGVIAVILFLLRKRIIGGIVGVLTLILVIGLTIFMFDFFWLGQNLKGEDRDIRNFEPTQTVVEGYDDTVKEPVKKAKDIGKNIVDKGSTVNDKIKSAGDTIDEKLGIQKDKSNNNLWGSDTGEEQDSEKTKHENINSTTKDSLHKEESDEIDNESTETKQKDVKNTNEEDKATGNKQDSSQKDSQSKKPENKLKFNQLTKAGTYWNISKEDAGFVKSASPFNLGEFSNGSITIKVEEDGVVLK